MSEPPAVVSADERKAQRATALVDASDMRIQVVQREVNHVLGLGREHVELADFGAALVIAALDSFDEDSVLTRFVVNGKRLVCEQFGDDHEPTTAQVEKYIPADLRRAYWRRYLSLYLDARTES